ncbi:hypothetical protein J4204_06560 [Candidatus Woesearchaeota archaeon]|nr:hypothetical protein [Candidatus Woesearchaeota archaeon]
MKGKENDEFGLNYSWNTKEDLDSEINIPFEKSDKEKASDFAKKVVDESISILRKELQKKK